MKRKLKPIAEQVVVVFGASSGIGRETALRFAKRGAKVVVAARGEEGLDSLVREIRQFGGEAISVVADAAEFEDVKNVGDTAARAFGRIDTWVHLASISLYASFEDTEPEEFRHILEVNLLGQVHGAKAALPHIKKVGRGALIHISSVESIRSFPFQSAYAASKHGMRGFLDALRLELRKQGYDGIAVTNVMPAGINTPLFNKARTKLGVKPRPIDPIYEPEIVADVILYAAEHPVRDIYAGGAGKLTAMSQLLFPRLTDAVASWMGFRRQLSDEPKSADDPDAFDNPMSGYDRVHGDFGDQSRRRSAYTWFRIHPRTRRSMETLLFGFLAAFVLRKTPLGFLFFGGKRKGPMSWILPFAYALGIKKQPLAVRALRVGRKMARRRARAVTEMVRPRG